MSDKNTPGVQEISNQAFAAMPEEPRSQVSLALPLVIFWRRRVHLDRSCFWSSTARVNEGDLM